MGADVAKVTWFACLNPLLVVDFIGGAHNDALMMGITIAGLWLGFQKRWWPVAAVVIGIAATIKQPAILAAYVLPLLTRPLPSWRMIREAAIAVGRVLASVAIAAASFVAISLACGLGFGWINATGVPGQAKTLNPSYAVGELLQVIFAPGGDSIVQTTQQVFAIGGFVIAIVLAIRVAPRRPIDALAYSYLVIAFTSQALHSWYVLWGALLLPLPMTMPAWTQSSTKIFAVFKRWNITIAVGLTIVLLTSETITLAFRNGGSENWWVWALTAAAVGLLGWSFYQHELSRRQPEKYELAPLEPPDIR
jgi:hypothetical protein